MTPKSWDATKYAETARFVADLASPVLTLLEARRGESILDLGCGDGYLTLNIAKAGATVVAVDGAPDMIAAARRLNLDARLADGENLHFDQQFDAVFSNAALHWMTRPDEVLDSVRRALKPGGRFVAEMGGHGNIASVRVAIAAVLSQAGIENDVLTQNYYPTDNAYRTRLEAHGFVVDQINLIPRPTFVKNGMASWLETFRGDVFDRLPREQARSFQEKIVDLLTPALRDEQGNWWLDYVRLRFKAHLPA